MNQSISISTLTILKIILIIIGFVLLYFIRDVLVCLILAIIIASAVRPIVDWLNTKKIPRVLGGIIIYFGILLILGLIIYLTLPSIIAEIKTLSVNFPQYWQSFSSWWKAPPEIIAKYNLPQAIQGFLQNIGERLSETTTGIFGFLSGLAGGVMSIFFILVISFYLSVQTRVMERFLDWISPSQYKEKVVEFWQVAEKKMGRWLQGYFILALVVGTLVYIGLKLLGVKYALLLAVTAGLLEIIPIIGPWIAGIIGFVVALFQSWWLAILVAILYIVIQQVENYLIVPSVMKKAVGLSPILVIIVLWIGGALGGILGMILAVPLTAVAVELIKKAKAKT